MLDLVGILDGVGVDALHARTLGCTGVPGLRGVDVVMQTIEQSDGDHGRDALAQHLHVVQFVDLASSHGVVTQGAHGPAQGPALLEQLGAQPGIALLLDLLVGELPGLGVDDALFLFCLLLGLGRVTADGSGGVGGVANIILIVLDDCVVGHDGALHLGDGRATEKQRALEAVVPLDGGVSPDNLGVDIWDEEESGQQSDSTTSAHCDRGDIPVGLLVQAQIGRALVDNRECADGTGDEEEEGRGPHGPWDRVLPNVHDQLNEHEDSGTEAGRDGRGHTETCEDSTQALALVPSPLDL